MADEEIKTQGGGVVKGDVDTSGDFIGRDRLNTTTTHHERTSNTNLSGNTIVTVLAVLIVGVIAALIIFRDRTPEPSTALTVGVATTTATPTTDEPGQANSTNTATPENTQAAVVDTAAAPTIEANTPISQPVQLPDGSMVTLVDQYGDKYRYTILSAQRELLSPNKYLLHLRIRAWTNRGAGMNFWNKSFRLYVGDQHLAPVSYLNKGVAQDETKDGDVDFGIDGSVKEAILTLSEFHIDTPAELRLVFP